MKTLCRLALVLVAFSTFSVSAGTLYVALDSPKPTPPYTNWASAATDLQHAIDAAVASDEIVVTNGVYATGGRAVYPMMPTRVVVDKPLRVRSVNGPGVTVIDGGRATRCVYLTNGASLSGFTLTNGFTDRGGGVLCESEAASVSNCVVAGNWAASGLGGGGAYQGTLNNCTLTGNSVGASGSGASGGGASHCTLNNCVVSGNSAHDSIVPMASSGGGANVCTLNNCTLTGNSSDQGGGAYFCTLNNCIVYYNTAPGSGANCSFGTLNYCCTTPLPAGGTGNINLDPQLASATYLSAGSPCRGAGSAHYATGVDIDGEAWAVPPSMGCDEYHAGAVTGPLNVGIAAARTQVAAGGPVGLTALIEGRTTTSVWEFGDGVLVTNQPYATHAWRAPADYVVVLRAYNESHPEGVSGTVTVHVAAPAAHYVAVGSTNPVPPYTSWVTAARTIQDAVDQAVPGEEIVVTNGVYATGGRGVMLTIRVAVDKALTVRSVNGPGVTVIDGRGPAQCVSLANGARLSGFTVTNGGADRGGGLWCESEAASVFNCVVVGNWATSGGGGAYQGTLYNCVLSGNVVPTGSGGGAYGCTLNNCTLTGNSATHSWAAGGGAAGCTLNNCIVYYNWAPLGANCSGGTLNYCCTTPMPNDDAGNITNAPLFVDSAGGNLRLQANSLCINAGNNAYVANSTDLDGRPRIVDGKVDIGAYEFQPGVSGAFIAWLGQYGLPTDGSADFADMDGDGMNNWQEWCCLTDPTNALSVLRLLSATPGGSNVAVRWQSVAGVSYFLERSADLAATPRFMPLATNLPGQPSTTTYLDTNAAVAPRLFYRVGVGN